MPLDLLSSNGNIQAPFETVLQVPGGFLDVVIGGSVGVGVGVGGWLGVGATVLVVIGLGLHF